MKIRGKKRFSFYICKNDFDMQKQIEDSRRTKKERISFMEEIEIERK